MRRSRSPPGILSDNRILGAPVVDSKQRLVGVVSASDILANELHVGHEVVTEREYYCRPDLATRGELRGSGMHIEEYADALVRDIMTPVIISAPPDATVAELADLMGVNRIHRVLVVEDDRLVGVVSALDLLAYLPRPAGKGDARAEVLWATDLGPDSDRVGRRALEFAHALGARLTILHVTPDLAALWAAYGEHPEVLDSSRDCRRRPWPACTTWSSKLEQEVPAVELLGLTGDPARVILAAVAERRPKLVVIGAQRPATARISGIGSVAEKVLADAPAQVLIVPPPSRQPRRGPRRKTCRRGQLDAT